MSRGEFVVMREVKKNIEKRGKNNDFDATTSSEFDVFICWFYREDSVEYIKLSFVPGVLRALLILVVFVDYEFSYRTILSDAKDMWTLRLINLEDVIRFQQGHVDHVGCKEKCEFFLFSSSNFRVTRRKTR